ncbi:hypothetical protein CIK84_11235 [Glutamicibacter arilaitensis]|uniref:Uncharacterized protein n=1 Tax=Glutamicibacter arilaitensis TaxID=256701 RepID=A0A2N7RZG0_9MICC|nr:hypothetical protein CIK84_11235 [Glutamicibacter arilaitensis]
MIDLPVASIQPYRDKTPWYDLSQLLTAGLTPFYPESCVAAPVGNFIHYALMIRIDQANPNVEDITLLRNLPAELRPAAATATTGWFTGGGADVPHRVEFSQHWAVMNRWRTMGLKLADFTVASLTLTAPRKAP